MDQRDRRLLLQTLLESLLGETESVYFQPPEGQNLSYPAIVYKRDSVRTDFADDAPYKLNDRYQVTYIDRSPDSDIPRKIQQLPMSRFASYFVVDGMNHYNHSIYF